MDQDRFETPGRTMRLDPRNVLRQGCACKICGAFSRPFDSADFLKFCSEADPFAFGLSGVPVQYHRCDDCGFIFTAAFDNWTPAEFASRIYNQDYALIDAEYESVRPNQMAQLMSERLETMRHLRILDYGSGSGGFGQRMRARGFQVQDYDPFSSPARPEGRFDLITCFEVIEHGPAPVELVADMAALLAEGGAIVFTQPLQPANIETIRASWWYVAPRNGHVSIFTADALALLAGRCGLVFHMGEWLHGFASPQPSPELRRLLGRLGQARACVRIAAPGEVTPGEKAASVERNPSSWHGVERTEAARYRWTRSDRLVFPAELTAAPTTLRVIVPFVNQIVPGFAADCRIEFAGIALPGRIEGQRLIAEHRFDRAVTGELALITPPPRSPRELGGANDPRPLGLAVPVSPWLPGRLPG